MEHNAATGSVAEIIRLAAAPVFLITGIGGRLPSIGTSISRRRMRQGPDDVISTAPGGPK